MKKSFIIVEERDTSSSLSRVLYYINKFYNTQFTNKDVSLNKNGKPFLTSSNISFNITDSNNIRSYIISDEEEKVGIDLQFIKPNYSTDALLKKGFKEDEIQLTKSYTDGFFLLWALKEALIKKEGKTIFNFKEYDITSYLKDFSSFRLKNNKDIAYLATIPNLNFELINKTNYFLERIELPIR